MKVATWNINSDRRAELGTNVDLMFKESYRLVMRLNRIMQEIKNERPDILFLQEINPLEFLDASVQMDSAERHMVEAELQKEGYSTQIIPYNASGAAFRLIIAWNPGNLGYVDSGFRALVDNSLLDPKQLYAEKNHRGNLSTDFHKNILFVELKDLREPGSETFFVFNTHLGLPWKHKLKATRVLLATISDVAGKKARLLAGDFNSFSDELRKFEGKLEGAYDREGDPKDETLLAQRYGFVPQDTQLHTLLRFVKEMGYSSLTDLNSEDVLVADETGNGKRLSSFIFYPYDKGPTSLNDNDYAAYDAILKNTSDKTLQEQRMFLLEKLGQRYPFGGRLDHIFGKGFQEVPGSAKIVIEEKYRRQPDLLRFDMINGYVPPSDHMMLVTEVSRSRI